MGAEDGAPSRTREPRADRPRKKKGGKIALILFLFIAAPAAAYGWYHMQPPEKQAQIQEKLPEGWEDRAKLAGLSLATLFVLATVVLPLLHTSAQGLGRTLAAMRRKPTWLRVLLFPFEIIVWVLFQVARLGRIADAVAILGLCVLFLVLTIRIMKPELLADVLPGFLTELPDFLT